MIPNIHVRREFKVSGAPGNECSNANLKGLPVVCKPVNSSNIGSRVASIGCLQYWTIVPTLVVCKEQVEEMQPGVEREWIPFSERQYVKKGLKMRINS